MSHGFDAGLPRRTALLLPALLALLLLAGGCTRAARAAEPLPVQALPAQEPTPTWTIDPFFLALTPGFTPTEGPTPTFTPTRDPTFIEVRSAIVRAASGANLRDGANINANSIAVLEDGSVHVVSQGPLMGGDAAEWVELALPGGGRGWILAELVAIDSHWLPYGEAASVLTSVGMPVPQPGSIPPTPEPPTSTPDPFAAFPTPDPFAGVPTPDPFAGLVTPDPFAGLVTPDPFATVAAPTESGAAPVEDSAPVTTTAPVTATAPITDLLLLPLTLEQLRTTAWVVPSLNITGTIQFVEGAFANTQTGLQVELDESLVAVGDLTGDGADDAAAILRVMQPDGTVSYDLVVALNQGAVPVALTGRQLGGPLLIDELRIAKGAIWVTMRIVGPGDDPCCPTLPLKRIYVLRGAELIELPAAAYGRTFPYRYGDLYGYVNVLGEFVVPPIYQFAGEHTEGLALVSRDGKRFGFINGLGQVVIPLEYTFATPFAGGLTVAGLPPAEGEGGAAASGEQVVYLDRRGRNIFGDATFAAGQPFREGLAAVKVAGGDFGYINRTGDLVIPAQFDFALAFSEGLAPVLQDDRVGYINRAGEMVIPVQFDAGGAFSEGLAAVAISGTVGYIDHGGDFVIEPTSARGSAFSEGLAAVTVEGREAYIDATGQIAFDEPVFTNAQEFAEGLAAVRVGERFGYLNSQGEMAIEPQFTAATPFRQGLATIEAGESWGVISADGTWLVQLTLLPLQPVTATTTTTTSTGTTGTTVLLDVPAAPATALLSFVPPAPDEIRQGACYAGSNIVASTTAWRCGLVGGELYDPCILAADGRTVVCNADPTNANAEPFALELTQPLPDAAVEGREFPGAWIFELETGAICRYAQGTSFLVEGERVNYACSDRTLLLGEINKRAPLWSIDAITTAGTTESGLTVATRTPQTLLRTWLPGAVKPAATGN